MTVADNLLAFVKDALGRGMPRDSIEAVLRDAGWSATHVNVALAGYADVDFPIPVPRPRRHWSSREAFLYLLLFTTLYLTAYYVGCLLFTFIERAFPDPAAASWMRTGEWLLLQMRWAIASLIVSTPVFGYLSWLTSREMRQDRSKRDSAIRWWLTYLTLFVAATALIGDFITLIYNALGGELTIRFVLKIVTVGSIAGATFGYYIWDLNAPVADDHGGPR